MNNEDQIQYEEEFGEVIDIPEASASQLKPSVIDINSVTGERVELSPLEKIKFAAEKFGIPLNDPNKNCKKCWGRGYLGVDVKTEIPVACGCITPKALKAASQGYIPTDRKSRRIMAKMQKRGQITMTQDASNI